MEDAVSMVPGIAFRKLLTQYRKQTAIKAELQVCLCNFYLISLYYRYYV